MYRIMVGLVMVAIVGVGAGVVGAQGGDSAGCNVDRLFSALQSLNTGLSSVASAPPVSNDPRAALDLLRPGMDALAVLDAACNGEAANPPQPQPVIVDPVLRFTGNNPRVIGPVSIPTGVYRAIATTDNFMIADITIVEGECNGDRDRALFILGRGQANAGAEALFTSLDCVMFVEISNVDTIWELRFEPAVTTGQSTARSRCDRSDARQWIDQTTARYAEFTTRVSAIDFDQLSSLGQLSTEIESANRDIDALPYPECLSAARDEMAQSLDNFSAMVFATGSERSELARAADLHYARFLEELRALNETDTTP